MKETKISYCKYCKLPKHQCQCTSGEWSNGFQCEHNKECEHYWQIADIDNLNYLEPRVIMICVKCGEVIKKTVK